MVSWQEWYSHCADRIRDGEQRQRLDMFLLPMLLPPLSILHWQRSTEKIVEPQVTEGIPRGVFRLRQALPSNSKNPLPPLGWKGLILTSIAK
jgi:hypothetical protein